MFQSEMLATKKLEPYAVHVCTDFNVVHWHRTFETSVTLFDLKLELNMFQIFEKGKRIPEACLTHPLLHVVFFCIT